MILKKFSSYLACFALIITVAGLSGCKKNNLIKQELEHVSLSQELPSVTDTIYTKLIDADENVYEQQIAACELYSEAYQITKTVDFVEKYKDTVKKKMVAYYCNSRRKELQEKITTGLHDNVYTLVKNVNDCTNMSAYLKRVNFDTVEFYDYYTDYINSLDTDKALCRILTCFYERNNILVFHFLDEHKEEVILAAINVIQNNSQAEENLNVYILKNNNIIDALNAVYGGIPTEYAQVVTDSSICLSRKMLEENKKLSAEDIDKLMQQLGESTPKPSPTPEPSNTPVPTATPNSSPIPTVVQSVKSIETLPPTQQPIHNTAASQPSTPTIQPQVQNSKHEPPQPTEQYTTYIFGE